MRRFKYQKQIKNIAIIGLTVFAGQIVFLNWLHDSVGHVARGYWMFLFISWVAVSTGMRSTILVLLIIAVQALVGAFYGLGFFADDLVKTHLLNYTMYMAILSTVGISLSTYVCRRNQIEKELNDYKFDLEHTVEERTHDLWKSNIEIRELNASLERRVEDRTAKLQEMNDEFRVLNETLAQSIEEEVERNREKDAMLLQQSRLAAMGEMMGNIAHQWRQPINALNLVLVNIEDAQRYGELTDEYLQRQVEKGERIVKSMSNTIDDFRNFFKSDGHRAAFDVKLAIENVLSIVDASFKSHQIAVEIIAPEEIKMLGVEGQYKQVLLNIFGNAKDALVERNVANPKIVITLTRENEQTVVRIRDNAGGIKEDVIEKVFDPYFTTRPQGNGIGLYMSKMIVENNMRGKLCVKNVEDGAEFVIKTGSDCDLVPLQSTR